MIKVIKDESEYEKALKLIEDLIDLDPEEGTPESQKLELLTLLIQDYESKYLSERILDPVDAIFFRMEQQNLKPRDLIPYIGSRSKVSEVLSGRRPLTMNMVKALHQGLGIPLESLLADPDNSIVDEGHFEWGRFPIKEMIARGWLDLETSNLKGQLRDFLRSYFSFLGSKEEIITLYRKTKHIRSGRSLDRYSLTAWTARIIRLSIENPAPNNYSHGKVNMEFMKNIARLSVSDRAPILAKNFLREEGIALTIEPHFPRTNLDGVSLFYHKKPIIGLTLRYDRLDNFWFTLMHELAHLSLHLDSMDICFYDDLDLTNPLDDLEKEADALASEVLIPSEEWLNSPARHLRTPEAARHLADKLNINPAIVAGLMRFESKSYRILKDLVGYGEVRKYFPEIKWGKK